MNIRALKSSIKHWVRLSTGKRRSNEDTGVNHCALCKIYHSGECEGCPVSEKTGQTYCDGSPFEAAVEVKHKYGISSKQFKQAAKRELKFLKSLLPKRRKK